MLGETADIRVAGASDIVETAPLGEGEQPKYMNAVAQIETTLGARDLHKRLVEIETSLGRIGREKWAPRTIDLDLLLFGDEVINSPGLTVPHRQMHLRSFVLSGLCQLNGELVHPVMKAPVRELAGRLGGADFVLNRDVPQLVSVAGIIGVGKTTLAGKLADSLCCKSVFEAYDKNPFMPDVYAGKKELALDSQLYFLTSRIEQLNPQAAGRGQIIISDYVSDKELIYARRLLNRQQLTLYEKVHQLLAKDIAQPVLVIYLKDSAERCLDRIHKRNRPYEQIISLEFLQDLSGDYERLFADWKLCPVIRVLMSEFDCMDENEVEHLANQVKSYVAV